MQLSMIQHRHKSTSSTLTERFRLEKQFIRDTARQFISTKPGEDKVKYNISLVGEKRVTALLPYRNTVTILSLIMHIWQEHVTAFYDDCGLRPQLVDTIKILWSRYYQDTIKILTRYYQDTNKILSRDYQDTIKILSTSLQSWYW